MVKQIILRPARTFSEFSVLPDKETTADCTISKVNLETDLAGLHLKIPLLSAAMTSVTGYEMALELGKRGGIGILPTKLSIEEQADIIRRIKAYEMEFVDNPVTVQGSATIAEALQLVEQRGHSTIPVIDEFRTLLGMFTQMQAWESDVGYQENVTAVMTPFARDDTTLPHLNKPDVTVEEVKQTLQGIDGKALVVIDEQDRFRKLAFKQDIEEIAVGAAIDTHPGWRKRVEAVIEAGADLIVIDTSEGFNSFEGKVLQEYKKMGTGVPICAGNVVTYKGALYLMERGADIVKLGMSSGSSCITQREKAVGRAPMAALLDGDRARRQFEKDTGRDVPLIWDGGAISAADFIIALTIAKAVMGGQYFNQFFESSGEKYDSKGKITHEESKMRQVLYYGEGSDRARNFNRYGGTRKTYYAQGEEKFVPYGGRLKPALKKDLYKIRDALSNSGCRDLKEFRQFAVLELMSPAAQGIVTQTYTLQPKE